MPKDTVSITKKQKGKYDKEKHGSSSRILFTTSLWQLKKKKINNNPNPKWLKQEDGSASRHMSLLFTAAKIHSQAVNQ